MFMRTVRSRLSAQKGFGLVEIVVGSSIIALVMLSVSFFFQKTLEMSNTLPPAIKAGYLLESGVDIVQNLRSDAWNVPSVGVPVGAMTTSPVTPYYLWWSGGRWSLNTTYQMIDGVYDRRITSEPVSRGSGGAISPVYNALENDPNTRKITVSVAWREKNATTTIYVVTYMTNLFKLL